jgi:hypothetical protein
VLQVVLLVLLLQLLQASSYFDAAVNDGIISRPRLLARDPTLFSLLRYIYTPSVVQLEYRSVCPACRTKWAPDAHVPFLEQRTPVSGVHRGVNCTNMSRLL